MSAYSSYSDNELFGFVRNDDEHAFRELYNRYWNKLLTQVLIKLKSPEEAEEITQEVFLQLWRRRKKIELRYTLHTYIASMVKYEILAKLSRQKLEAAFKMRIASLSPDEDNSTTDNTAYEFLRKKIEKTIQLLPDKCRLVFRLSREAGMTEKQIAETLNIAPKTVEAHMSKALKTLRGSLRHFFAFCINFLLLLNASL